MTPLTLYGRRVQISSRSHRMQCTAEFSRIQSPDLVRETNAWMANFFGANELLPDGVIYELNKDILVMNQSTWDQVQKAVKK